MAQGLSPSDAELLTMVGIESCSFNQLVSQQQIAILDACRDAVNVHPSDHESAVLAATQSIKKLCDGWQSDTNILFRFVVPPGKNHSVAWLEHELQTTRAAVGLE